jgi:hypothetical protein
LITLFCQLQKGNGDRKLNQGLRVSIRKSYLWTIVLPPLLLAMLVSRLTSQQVTAEPVPSPYLNNPAGYEPAIPVAQQTDKPHNYGTSAVQHIHSVRLSPGYRQNAKPGSVVTYTHTLTNTGDVSDTFILDIASSQGWPVALLGGASSTGTVRLPLPLGAGLTTTFQVELSVPSRLMSGTLNIITGTVDTTIITATSQTSRTVYATLTDTTTVIGVQRVFLPLILALRPPLVKLGVDFGRIVTGAELLEHDIPLVREMGASWVRIYLAWLDIEESPGQYNWEPYDAVFERLVAIGLQPLPIVYGAPEWAAEESCGPISDTLAFEGFLEVVLERYGAYTNAWEFTNEPDGRYPHPWGPTAGCWGFYPAAYASQLGVFYNKIKALDPDDLVVFGGLAYDRWEVDENVERSFFTETLRYGAGQFFDVANVHYYPINPVRFPTMAHKVSEIRDIMTTNGVQGKRIWVTETGMWVNLKGSVEIQRNFIARELTRGFGAGVDNIFWFDPRERPVLEGQVHRWLISMDHQPINGYGTFQHYADKLAGTSCTGRYDQVPADVEAYKFAARGRSLFVLWSNTVTQTVTIPATADAILTDRDGNASRVISIQDGQVSFEVGGKPIFLEMAQTGFTH